MKTFKEFFTLGVNKPTKQQIQDYLNRLGSAVRLMTNKDLIRSIEQYFKTIKNLKLDRSGRRVLSFEEVEKKIEEANSKYIVSKNPNDKKWYVMGHVGNNKWMPVSDGFKNKAQAQKWAKSQDKVDSAARGEIGDV